MKVYTIRVLLFQGFVTGQSISLVKLQVHVSLISIDLVFLSR